MADARSPGPWTALAVMRSVAVLALAASALTFGLSKVWPFTIDDSGIVYAYAKHLASGLGFRAVVGGPVVEGYSDFLWVVLLSVVTRLGFDTPAAAKVLGALCLVACCAAAGGIVRLASPAGGRGIGWAQAIPAVALGLCPELVVWGPSGLENGLYMALIMTALWLDLRESERGDRFAWSAVAALGVALTRPEGIAYGAAIGLVKLVDAIRLGGTARRRFSMYLIALAAPLALYHAWHYWMFRGLVPNTYLAKAPGGSWDKGIAYVKAGIEATAALYMLPVALLGCILGLRRTAPTMLSAAAALAFAVYSRGDWMPHYRFVGLAFPAIATLAAVGVGRSCRVVGGLARWKLAGPLLSAGAVLGGSALWYRHHASRFDSVRRIRWCHFCSRSEDARNHEELRDRLGLREASFLTHDFGGPSFASTPAFFPIDLLGLCDRPAALLNFQLRRTGLPRYEFLRLQYFFHEQDSFPTLLYFPQNFWRSFGATPEARWAYVDARPPPKDDGRVIAPTRLFRGAFVDFFPPVERFVFQPLGDRFVLVGAGVYRKERERPELELDVSLLQKVASGKPASFAVRARGVSGPAVTLFGKQPELGARFGADEPLLVRVPLPAAAGPGDALELELVVGGEPAAVHPLSIAVPGSADVRPAPLPFPSTLPGTDDATLLELERRARRLIDERHERGDHTLTDAGLGEQLAAFARAARARGASSDEYLALVRATQAAPDLIRTLSERIAALRPGNGRVTFLEERALLGELYRSGDALVQLDLSLFYAEAGSWDKAAFFAERLPDFRPGTPAEDWSRELERARRITRERRARDVETTALAPDPLPGTASDFEGELSGWELDGNAFGIARDDGRIAPVLGVSGKGFLSSENQAAAGVRATGEARSLPFNLDARALGFLVTGGASKRLSIDLVVDGKVVEHATGPGSRCFFPVLWDLRPYRGKQGFLRLKDDERNGFVAIDRIRLWPDLASPGPMALSAR